MPTDLQLEALRAVEIHGSQNAAARALGIGRSTLQGRLTRAALHRPQATTTEIAVEPAPPSDEPLSDLIARKKAQMARSQAHEEWSKLVPVKVKLDGPIAVCLVGDPHVDDDGCDIAALERDLTTVGKTRGFFAGHVGDFTNNWVGRLARLYAHQSTKARDGFRLTEWMFGLCPSLFAVNGNHDCWNEGEELLNWIVKAGVHQSHGVRLALRWGNKREVRIHARHNFPGKSQFSDTHGMKRELLWGHKDHVLVAGHIHTDEARVEPSVDGMAHWMFRVSGYKVIDDYAKEGGFREKRLAPSVSVIVDPDARIPAEMVKPFWCTAAAADYLTFLRKRRT